jgi:DNA polymerase-3 subunit epsilon
MIATKEYNLRVAAFITNNSFENKNMVIVEKRTVNERSAVLVENGVYKGYTFYDLNYQITNIEILKHTHSDAKP